MVLGEDGTTRELLLRHHGPDAVKKFNDLELSWRFLALHTMSVLEDQLNRRTWDDERNSKITAAVRSLEAAVLEAERAEPDGAVLRRVEDVVEA